MDIDVSSREAKERSSRLPGTSLKLTVFKSNLEYGQPLGNPGSSPGQHIILFKSVYYSVLSASAESPDLAA